MGQEPYRDVYPNALDGSDRVEGSPVQERTGTSRAGQRSGPGYVQPEWKGHPNGLLRPWSDGVTGLGN